MKVYNISELKAHISEAIRYVKKGNNVQILDRSTPVAKLIPFPDTEDDLKIRHPLQKSQAGSLYTDIKLKEDIQKILQEDRGRR